jgi:hypothetical protein
MINWNRMMDARNCPALSSCWFCKRSHAWTTTGYDVLKVCNASVRLVHQIITIQKLLVRLISDILHTFKTSYPVVVHAWERLQNQHDDKAGQFLASIMRFQFIIALVIAVHILHSIVYLFFNLPMCTPWHDSVCAATNLFVMKKTT